MNPVLSRLMALLEILKSENQALEHAKFSEAIALLPEKQAATTALTQAVESTSPHESTSSSESPHHHLIEQFARLSTRNAALLERAITAQRRVVELLTAPPSDAEPQGYGQQGGYTSANTTRQATFFISNA